MVINLNQSASSAWVKIPPNLSEASRLEAFNAHNYTLINNGMQQLSNYPGNQDHLTSLVDVLT